MTPETLRELTEQRVAKITNEAMPRWWNTLPEHQRKALKSGSLPMSEWAFKAGVRAALSTLSNKGEEQ